MIWGGGLMEQYVSWSDWYLTDTEHPPLLFLSLDIFWWNLYSECFKKRSKLIA